MFNINKMLLVLFVPLTTLLWQPQITNDYTHETLPLEKVAIKEVIKCIAPAYGQNPALIDRIVFLESSYNPNAIHDGGKGKGAVGFHKTTFEYWNKTFFKETGKVLVYENNADQIELMSWAFSKGEQYRMAWSTYRKIKA